MVADASRSHLDGAARIPILLRALRPAQWVKNGVIFAGLVFGGKLFEFNALWSAFSAFVWFSLLCSGFYLINDVRDLRADRMHPQKHMRPVAAGELSPVVAGWLGLIIIAIALAGAANVNEGFLFVALAYSALMAAYNLGLKQIVIVDVFVIAFGFVLRAAGGAVAVDVSISPWLLVCTLLLALLLGFGKRRHELVMLGEAGRHRRSLDVYSRTMLDQSVAMTAAGTLIAYAVYTIDRDAAPFDHRMMLTIPIVAYGIFRYLYLLYQRDLGGAPESMLLTDRPLLASVATWSVVSALLFYLAP
jgi:4-hydroxybenzoate polyprenyltransferase